MTQFRGVCDLCGRIWQVEGQATGPGPVYDFPCPLDGQRVIMHEWKLPGKLDFEQLANNGQLIVDLTETKWPEWFDNLAQNLDTIRTGLDLNTIPKRKGLAVIVGAGPSIHRQNSLKTIAKNRERIPTLISTDKMLKPLLEHGVKPDYVCTVDGSQIISKFYNLSEKTDVDVILDAVTIHPETLREVKKNVTGKIYWFVHFVDNPTEQRCNHCRRLSTTANIHFITGKKLMMQASGNVGALGWHVAQFLGCNPIILVGMDYSYPPDVPIEETMYYGSFLSMTGGNHSLAKQCYETRVNPAFKNSYVVDPVWHVYKNVLTSFIKSGYPATTTINATGAGALHDEPIVSMTLEEALLKYSAREAGNS